MLQQILSRRMVEIVIMEEEILILEKNTIKFE